MSLFDDSGADPRGWWQLCATLLFFSPIWALLPFVLGIGLIVERGELLIGGAISFASASAVLLLVWAVGRTDTP